MTNKQLAYVGLAIALIALWIDWRRSQVGGRN